MHVNKALACMVFLVSFKATETVKVTRQLSTSLVEENLSALFQTQADYSVKPLTFSKLARLFPHMKKLEMCHHATDAPACSQNFRWCIMH
jgi:hypothetical protein